MKEYSFLQESQEILEESLVIRGRNNQKIGHVDVNGKEGAYPHCHFIHKDCGNREVCVCLHTDAYFIHKTHRNRFRNNKEKIIFDNVMKTPYEYDPAITIWEKLVMLWNLDTKNNSRQKFAVDLSKVKQPNYSNISKTIQDI